TNAKTFIARNRNAAPNKGQVAAKANIEKSPRRNSKLQPLAKKVQQAQGLHRSLHASIVPDDAPSMQRGALSKLQDLQVKGSTKSTSSIIAPLNNAIKSLDSATKLLGAVAAGKTTTPLANTVQVNKFVSAPAIANPAFVPKAKAVNASLLDVPSIARSAATTSDAKAVADVTGGKPSSSAPASSAVQGM
ncbi:MAG: hypothetical protein GY776_11400, partial [Alteromonas sp.]|nr:hypothetical protein [Alteromonas sp.]